MRSLRAEKNIMFGTKLNGEIPMLPLLRLAMHMLS